MYIRFTRDEMPGSIPDIYGFDVSNQKQKGWYPIPKSGVVAFYQYHGHNRDESLYHILSNGTKRKIRKIEEALKVLRESSEELGVRISRPLTVEYMKEEGAELSFMLVPSERTARFLQKQLRFCRIWYRIEREKKEFAQSQIEYLMSLGFRKGQAYQIMKLAGPGHVKKSIEWAKEALKDVHGNYDVLDVIFQGIGGQNAFGMSRMKAVLESLGLPVPACSSAHAFDCIMAGAQRALEEGYSLLLK